MSEPFRRYAESVVHPFGNNAIGATLPDRFQELVIPITDALEFDLTPGNLNYPGGPADWQQEAGVQLTGVFMWFQPRCIASGTIANRNATGTGQAGLLNINAFIPVDDTFSLSSGAEILTAYQLCITGMWTYSGGLNGVPAIAFGLFNGGTEAYDFFAPAYLALQYSRFDNIASNCDKLRILGAGLKVWSEQAPINTGGYSIGGWITLEDIRQAMTRNQDLTAVTPGALASIVPSIKYRVRTPGVKGSTVRYSSLQTSEQIEPEYPLVPSRLFNVDIQTASDTDVTTSPFIIDEVKTADLAVNDLITPGSFVPCIYWHFNVTDSTSNENVTNTYTLKIMSMVHSEGTPTGNCPFMAGKSKVDPAVQHVKLMLENLEQFPPAAEGHSFKSFVSKAAHIVGKISKFASKTSQIMQLVDKAFGM
jgi:hypothetical protein